MAKDTYDYRQQFLKSIEPFEKTKRLENENEQLKKEIENLKQYKKVLIKNLEDMSSILKETRLKKNWSQKILSEKAGVTQQTISYLETGTSTPSIKLILHLCELLNLQVTIHPHLRGEKINER